MATSGNGTKSRDLAYTPFENLDPKFQRMLRAAQVKLDQSASQGGPYNPYSGFAVAAAFLTNDGQIIVGTNMENAAYGSSICAERTTISTAHNQGIGNKLVAVAVVARPREGVTHEVTGPCGECCQVMREVAFRAGIEPEEFTVIVATTTFDKVAVLNIPEAAALGFGPNNLNPPSKAENA